MSEAIGVLLTFTTYGTHLHGADAGSVSRNQRNWGYPTIPCNTHWERQAQRFLAESKFFLSPSDRGVVLNSVVDTCAYRAWHLFCAHVRTNHVHAVLQADTPVERALAYLKARASFALKARHSGRERFWTKHGSTRQLWNRVSLSAAIDYVVNRQGGPMELWVGESAADTNRFAHGSGCA